MSNRVRTLRWTARLGGVPLVILLTVALLALPAYAWTAVYYKNSSGVAGVWYSGTSTSLRVGGNAYSHLYASRMRLQTNVYGQAPIQASGGTSVDLSHPQVAGSSRCRDDSPYTESKYAHHMECYFKRV